jgi:hypothetical protein
LSESDEAFFFGESEPDGAFLFFDESSPLLQDFDLFFSGAGLFFRSTDSFLGFKSVSFMVAGGFLAASSNSSAL